MPLFETEYEKKLYEDRASSLEKIAALGESLGLTRAQATYPNSFRFTHTIPELRERFYDTTAILLAAGLDPEG